MHVWGQGTFGKELHLPLNLAVNLKPLWEKKKKRSQIPSSLKSHLCLAPWSLITRSFLQLPDDPKCFPNMSSSPRL